MVLSITFSGTLAHSDCASGLGAPWGGLPAGVHRPLPPFFAGCPAFFVSAPATWPWLLALCVPWRVGGCDGLEGSGVAALPCSLTVLQEGDFFSGVSALEWVCVHHLKFKVAPGASNK